MVVIVAIVLLFAFAVVVSEKKQKTEETNAVKQLVAQPRQTNERMREARAIAAMIRQEAGFEVTAIAAGERNETIVFASELFGNAEWRQMFVGRLRDDPWKRVLCHYGFKKVHLDEEGKWFGGHDYELSCGRQQ